MSGGTWPPTKRRTRTRTDGQFSLDGAANLIDAGWLPQPARQNALTARSIGCARVGMQVSVRPPRSYAMSPLDPSLPSYSRREFIARTGLAGLSASWKTRVIGSKQPATDATTP